MDNESELPDKPVDLSNLDENIKETPYNDDELKKSISHIRLFAIFSIVIIYVLSSLFTIIRLYSNLKMYNFENISIMSVFYFSLGSGILIELIIILCLALMLRNYYHLSDYNKKNFSIRSGVYAAIIIFSTIFLFTGLIIGDNITEEYREFKELDNALPLLVEVNSLELEGDLLFKEYKEINIDIGSITQKDLDKKMAILISSREKLIKAREFLNLTRESKILIEKELVNSEYFELRDSLLSKKIELLNVEEEGSKLLGELIVARDQGNDVVFDEKRAEADAFIEKEKKLAEEISSLYDQLMPQ